MYIFTAANREELRIIDFKVSRSRDFSAYLEMALRLEKYNIEYVCSDDKAETSLVKAKNSLFRDNLAKLNRKTKRYPKSIVMLEFSIYILLFLKNFRELFSCFYTMPSWGSVVPSLQDFKEMRNNFQKLTFF